MRLDSTQNPICYHAGRRTYRRCMGNEIRVAYNRHAVIRMLLVGGDRSFNSWPHNCISCVSASCGCALRTDPRRTRWSLLGMPGPCTAGNVCNCTNIVGPTWPSEPPIPGTCTLSPGAGAQPGRPELGALLPRACRTAAAALPVLRAPARTPSMPFLASCHIHKAACSRENRRTLHAACRCNYYRHKCMVCPRWFTGAAPWDRV